MKMAKGQSITEQNLGAQIQKQNTYSVILEKLLNSIFSITKMEIK